MGSWSSEAVGPGQVSTDLSGNPYGIDGAGDSPATRHATGSEPAGDEPKRRAFVGTLGATRAPSTDGVSGSYAATTVIDSILVTLQTAGGGEQLIGLPGPDPLLVAADGRVDSDFVRTPGGPRKGTLTEGARVVVLGQETDGGEWEAVWILVKPVKPPPTIRGVVVEVDGNEVTIETPKGDKKTVTLPEHARGVAHGEVVTVFEGDEGKAKGLVRAEEVKNRLKGFLDDAEQGVDESDGDDDDKGKNHDKAAAHLARIDAFLEGFNNRRAQLIDGVIGGAPQRVKDKLLLVKERIHAQRLAHRETVGRIWAKLDRIHPAHSHRGGSEPTDQPRPDNSDRRPDGAGQPRPENAGQDPDGEEGEGRGRGRGRNQVDGSDTPTP